MAKLITIYQIQNLINGKVYIGRATFWKDRRNYHKRALRLGIHNNIHLQRSWNKYGSENFEFSILEQVDTIELANKLEQFYIDYYDTKSEFGYNILDVTGGKKFTKTYTAFGKTQTLDLWSKEYGVKPKRIRDRIRKGMSIEAAIKNPVRNYKAAFLWPN